MPAMMVWPESMSVRTLKGGVFLRELRQATPIFSWSALVLGLDGDLDDGLGEVDRLEPHGCLSLQMVSPVMRVLEADGGRRCRGHDLG